MLHVKIVQMKIIKMNIDIYSNVSTLCKNSKYLPDYQLYVKYCARDGPLRTVHSLAQ